MRAPTKSPMRNLIGPTTSSALRHSPPGIITAIIGMRMSATNADTSFPAAEPIMTPIANPITPYLFRNSKNSSINDFFTGGAGGGGGGAGLGARYELILDNSSNIFS